MNEKDIDRRRFLQAGAAGILGSGLLNSGASARCGGQEDAKTEEESSEKKSPGIRRYNVLGKTGLKVSDLSMGIARETAVYQYALDLGVNLFDTAESYHEGQHETEMGEALKGVRDKVFLITKHWLNPNQPPKKQEIIDRFDASLRRLGTDYVDIAMWHQVDDPSILQNDEIKAAYEDLEKAGKYRHLGFSTHASDKVCPPAFETGLFSVMMVIYNSMQHPDRSENIAKAGELGIGVIAMKTLMGREQDKVIELVDERTSFSQAAVKWALTDQHVQSVVITMQTFEQMEEYLKASGETLSQRDGEILKKYAKAADSRYCRIGCSLCRASCPHRVAVNDIMRFGMYFDNYKEELKAVQSYASLAEHERASPCAGCSAPCEGACPHSLAVRERLVRYHRLLRRA